MRTNVPHIFSLVYKSLRLRLLAHSPCTRARWPRKSPPVTSARPTGAMIPSLAYTEPEIAWVGLTEASRRNGTAFRKGAFPLMSNWPLTLARGRGRVFTNLLCRDPDTPRVLGGASSAQRLRPDHEVAGRVEAGCDGSRPTIGAHIHPHPHAHRDGAGAPSIRGHADRSVSAGSGLRNCRVARAARGLICLAAVICNRTASLVMRWCAGRRLPVEVRPASSARRHRRDMPAPRLRAPSSVMITPHRSLMDAVGQR